MAAVAGFAVKSHPLTSADVTPAGVKGDSGIFLLPARPPARPPYMSLIMDNLFLGSKSDAKNFEFLVSSGITHILNVTPTRVADPVAGVPNYFEKDGRFT